MAIRILLDHGVGENHIIFVTFLAAPRGVHVLNRLFPKVKIVTGSADPTLTPIWVPGNGDQEGRSVLCIEPGMGHIGWSILCSIIVSPLTLRSQVIGIISDCPFGHGDNVGSFRLMYLRNVYSCFAHISKIFFFIAPLSCPNLNHCG